MNYFLLSHDPCCTDGPELTEWRGKIDAKYILPGRSHYLPDRQVISVLPNAHMQFWDVLFSPFFLLSPLCMDVIRLYEPYTVSKQMILLDMENKQKQTYYLPILQRVDCLAEGSRWNLDKSVLKEAILDLDKIGDASIFQLDGLASTYTVVRLDLLESILKRGARGVGITPLKQIRGWNK